MKTRIKMNKKVVAVVFLLGKFLAADGPSLSQSLTHTADSVSLIYHHE